MVVADAIGCRKARARTGALVLAFSTPDLVPRPILAEALGKAGYDVKAMTLRGGPNPYSTLVPARNPAAPRSATKRSVIVGQKP
jgi:hypothetical protein